MKEQVIFDPSITGYKNEHDIIGSILIDQNADPISSGDGNADNVANTFRAYDSRSFAFAYDSVGDNWDRLRQTNGALHVDIQDAELTVNIEGDYAEDSAHTSGDRGLFGLSIRVDDITADNSALLAGTNGDYQGTFTNIKGELYTKDTDVLAQLQSGVTVSDGGGSITVDATDLDIRALDAATDSVTSWIRDSDGDALQAYNSQLQTADIITTLANSAIATVGATAPQAIVGSALANRKKAWLYNNSKKKMFVGAAGITASTGLPFPPGSMYEFNLGSAAVMHVLGTDAGDAQDFRVMEGA